MKTISVAFAMESTNCYGLPQLVYLKKIEINFLLCSEGNMTNGSLLLGLTVSKIKNVSDADSPDNHT